jgi:site-specific DNA-methyltransferase (cytosine-N4-specific)
MCTTHKIIIGNSNQMHELAASSIDLMITSPPYPMIKMWDDQFFSLNPKIKRLWENLLVTKKEETLHKIFQLMHDSL